MTKWAWDANRHVAYVTSGTRIFEIIVSPMKRGGFLWEVIDMGSASRLPACEGGVALTIEEGRAAAEAIAMEWAA